MKTARKCTTYAAFALILAVILSLFAIFGAGKNEAEHKSSETAVTEIDTVSENSVVLIPGNDYKIIFDSKNQQYGTFATSLRGKFSQPPKVSSDSMSTETQNEILIGNTNRALSGELYADCVASVKNDSLVWGYAYRDGKFAFTASSDEAFMRAQEDFLLRFVKDRQFVVQEGLWLIVSLSRADYEAELKAEQDRIEAEKEAAKQKEIEKLKEKIASFTFADFTDDVTLDDTIMSDSVWGKPNLYPTSEHPRLNVNKEILELVREYIKSEEGTVLYNKLVALADSKSDGTLDAAYEHTSGRKGYHNMDEKALAIIEARAFLYILTGDEFYGYQAILSMKNFLKTVDIRWIHSDQCREFGRIIYCTAEVYDWCYDLLTEDDRNQFMIAVTDICSGTVDPEYSGKCQSGDRLIEVGYPPSAQGSVSGHGSEHQILRDYLSVAIAIFDENPSWYNYVAARVYNDYIVTRNYYYQSGTYQQGIFNYATFRHNADLWSAWLLLCAVGENPYVPELQDITNSFFEYQISDGSFFGTGDGSRPKAVNNNMATDAMLVMALYGDKNLRTRVLDAWNHYKSFTGTSISMSCAHALILNAYYVDKTGTHDGVDIHDGKDVISYHSSPIGQIIARSEWENPNAPAVFMKIGERTTANHEHGDAGSFQIFYKGLYVGESGVYDKYGSTHFNYYHQATVSHNSLLVFNPALADSELKGGSVDTVSNAARIFYSGSQRKMGETSTLESWLNNSNYTTGEVIGREWLINQDGTADYAYLAGDISQAYSATQASYVGRRMLTLFTDDESYPMIFIVYDKIDAPSEEFVKKFLLHTPSEPEVDTGAGTVTLTDSDGRLVLHSLMGGETIEALGGENKNYLINGVQCAGSSTNSDGMWGRVEISNTGSLSSEFLSFMYVTDATNDEKLSPITIESELLLGVQFGSTVTVFAKSAERNSEELVFTSEGTGINRYFVAGLFEGTWNITVDGVTVAHRVSSVEGGMITFFAPAGEIRVQPGKDIAPSNGGRIVYNAFGGIVPDDAPQVYEIGIPVTLPESITRGDDVFLGWYTSPTFEEETRVTEISPTVKGKFNVYAKYKSFPVRETYENRNFAFGEKTAIHGKLSYVGSNKTGSWFETVKDEATGNTFVTISRTITDMQLDSTANVGEYIGTDTKITYEVDLAKDGDKVPLSSNFRLRESSNKQTVTLFNTTVDGNVTFGGTTLFRLSDTFQKVIITVDFAEGTMTAYNSFGDKVASKGFTVPAASTAETTLDWMYNLSYTFNWWMGGGESIRIDNVMVYCGEFSAEDQILPEGVGKIIYQMGAASLPYDAPRTFKVNETLTLPIPTVKNGMFIGWYTTQTFDPDSLVTEITPSTTDPITLYAKCALTVLKEDFTGSTLDISDQNITVNGIMYQLQTKIGSYAKALTQPNGNTYMTVYTDTSDAGINSSANIINAIINGNGKITYTIDLASVATGRNGNSEFRLRASGGYADIIPLFTTSKSGDIKLGGAVKIGSLSDSFTKVIITLDARESTITAYDVYGDELAKHTISVPEISTADSLDAWLNDVSYCFNWHIQQGGGIAFDNVNIYSGEYVPVKTEVPENSVKVNYITNGGSFTSLPDKYVSNESDFTLPTDITNGQSVFLGWYTNASFDESTKVTKIPAGAEGEFTVFAKWLNTVFTDDFEDSTLNVTDEATQTVNNIQYQLKGKTGATAQVMTDAKNNKYIRVATDTTDTSVNSYFSLADAIAAGAGKITYTIDLAVFEGAKSTNTTFRIRSGASNNILPLFSTKEGVVYLGAQTAKPITNLTGELQRIAITLDAANGILTAYSLYGEVLATANVSVPAADTNAANLTEWISSANYSFNWYFNTGAGLNFDNIAIYAGEYVPEIEVIPEGHAKVTYNTAGGAFENTPATYVPTDTAFTLPTPTKAGFIFAGWFTSENLSGAAVTEIPAGSLETYVLYAAWAGKVYDEDFSDNEDLEYYEKNGAVPTTGLQLTAAGKTGAGVKTVKDEAGNIYLVFERGAEGNDPQLRNNTTKMSVGTDGKVTFHLSLALPDEAACIGADCRVRNYDGVDENGKNLFTDFLLFKIANGGVYLGENKQSFITLGEDFSDVTITVDTVLHTLTAYSKDGTVVDTCNIDAKFDADWFLGVDTPIYLRAVTGDAIKIDNIWIANCGFNAEFLN